MKFTILAPAFYNSWDKVKYLKQSAERWNIPITFYGFGEPYKGWHYVQIDRLIQEVEKIKTEWVIYTDASDTILNGPHPTDAIITDSVEPLEPWDDLIVSIESDKQMCAGGWLGRRGTALNYLRYLKDFKPCKECGPDSLNPQIKWRCLLKWGLGDISNDSLREIFQVADEPLEVRNGRVYNPRTQTFPFIIHWAGGYSSPEIGKEALMGDICRQLDYE